MRLSRTILSASLIALAMLLAGCVYLIDNTISKYHRVSGAISLGDSRDAFFEQIYHVQSNLSERYKKGPDKCYKDNVLVEIYYVRSRRQADGLTTDDEFTPYLFNDGILVGVGWASIGGPKTQGQTRDQVVIQHDVIIY